MAGIRGMRQDVPSGVALTLVAAAVLVGGGQAAASQAGRAGSRPAAPAAGTISTIAGGVGGPGPATAVAISSPEGVLFSGGAMYVADGGSIRQVSPQTGRLTTPVGNGTTITPGDGGPAAKAGLDDAFGVAAGPGGSLLIAGTDPDNGLVRMVAGSTGTFYGLAMSAGHIYTVAGGGHGGDDGPATSASLAEPGGVAVDAAGNLVVTEIFGCDVRVVAASTGMFYGKAMTAGDIYTVAGNGSCEPPSEFGGPEGVTVDGAGNLVVADTFGSQIQVVAETTGTFYGQAMTAGDVYTIAGTGAIGFSGDGGPATGAHLGEPGDAVLDAAGNVLIADSRNNRVRVVAESTGRFYGRAMTAGDIYSVAGNGTQGFAGDTGLATGAELDTPAGVGVDSAGNLLIADTRNNRVRVVAESSGSFYGQAMTARHIYTVAGNGTGRYDNDLGTGGFSGDGGPAARAELGLPFGSPDDGIALDGAGDLAIVDSANNRIRFVPKSSGSFFGQAMAAGDIYTVAGDGSDIFSGDGGPATSAGMLPNWVAIDHAGNLVIADTGDNRVRVVAAATGTLYGQSMAAGDIYTVAGTGAEGYSGNNGPATSAELSIPQDVAVDPAGDLLIADSVNNRVRLVAEHTGHSYGRKVTAGDIYNMAGNGTKTVSGDDGPGFDAGAPDPQGVAIDRHGNLVVVSAGFVRVVAASTGSFYGQAMTIGHIYTVAGTGGMGLSGDGGPATSAEFDLPAGVAVTAAGNLAIGDTRNCRVRMVAERTGAFYGQPMIAGDIYTVAGDSQTSGSDGCLGGLGGFSGDGGPATGARLTFPAAVAVDGAGNLLFADTGNQRVRQVAG